MSRRFARETCFKLMFEYEFLHQKNDITLQEFLDSDNLDQEDKKFVTDEYADLINYDEKICQIISKYLKGYTLNRIYKVDLAILKIAIYEMLFSKYKTPSNVVINEAVELAKKYSTDKGYSFVNGILASIVNGESDAKQSD